jgi:hypothetical protein
MNENDIFDIANEEVVRQRKHLRPNEQIELGAHDGFLELKAKHVFYDRDGGLAEAKIEMFVDTRFANPAHVGMEVGEGIRSMLYRLRNEEVER